MYTVCIVFQMLPLVRAPTMIRLPTFVAPHVTGSEKACH